MVKDWNYWKREFVKQTTDENPNDIIMSADAADSPIEKIVGLYLSLLYESYPVGILKIHPQVGVEKYWVDYLVTFEINGSEEIQIVIECDGHDWHEKTKQQVARDKKRDREMTLSGYHILRYSGSEIVENPMRVVIEVKELLQRLLKD